MPMMSMIALAWVSGCFSEPEPPAAPTQEKVAKSKPGKAKSKAKGKKPGAKPTVPAVGASGPVVGALVLTPVEPAPTPAGKTHVAVDLTFGEDGSATVELGKVNGTCSEVASESVGPEGREQVPTWTLRCKHREDRTVDLFILQTGKFMSLIKFVESTEPNGKSRFVPIKRIPLADGATLTRDQG